MRRSLSLASFLAPNLHPCVHLISQNPSPVSSPSPSCALHLHPSPSHLLHPRTDPPSLPQKHRTPSRYRSLPTPITGPSSSSSHLHRLPSSYAELTLRSSPSLHLTHNPSSISSPRHQSPSFSHNPSLTPISPSPTFISPSSLSQNPRTEPAHAPPPSLHPISLAISINPLHPCADFIPRTLPSSSLSSALHLSIPRCYPSHPLHHTPLSDLPNPSSRTQNLHSPSLVTQNPSSSSPHPTPSNPSPRSSSPHNPSLTHVHLDLLLSSTSPSHDFSHPDDPPQPPLIPIQRRPSQNTQQPLDASSSPPRSTLRIAAPRSAVSSASPPDVKPAPSPHSSAATVLLP